MSEELLQTVPQNLGSYVYYKLGNTTLNQLKNNGKIPKRNYGHLGRKKPDGLVLFHNEVKAVVEYKYPDNLRTETGLAKAIEQEIAVAKALCKILIITDGSKSFWINALNGEFITDQYGNRVEAVFNPVIVKGIDAIEHLISSIDSSISETTSTIQSAKLIDPSPLAARLWQTIWVATGKSPIKCLYNVVELFIFKFLSDLQILGDDHSFAKIYSKAVGDPSEALEYYARNTRNKIYDLFPLGDDGTTIINGTIFVNEKGEANKSQSILFFRSLDHLKKYSEEFGSLTQIDKQFKTKLYESFLNQEVEALGQYFTPRKIVRSMIRMAGLDDPSYQYNGKRYCDPFCGVGGFPLEMLNMNDNMRNCYVPDKNGKINLPFTVHGFDKGFERDDERTIILAKANMLIYLAEILFTNSPHCVEFARAFNETFTLFKDNLGTFGKIISDEASKYDLIYSNPPYVTSGSGIIKEEIQKTARTRNEYPVNAFGLEGLSVEWIIKSLKKGGKAFLVIPDGILGRVADKKLRDHILSHCFLEAIVSLPTRTFFANFENTYILVLTKKNRPEDVQSHPVFTYLVSEIGERLTSVKREEIEENDLPEMETLFKAFTGSRSTSKSMLEAQSARCKIVDIERFRTSLHWVVDRWWSREERISIGLEEAFREVTLEQINAVTSALNKALKDYDDFVEANSNVVQEVQYKEVVLGNESLFNLLIGKRIVKRDLANMKGDIPAYSANVFVPFGYIEQTNISDFSYPSILWGIDGNFDTNLIEPGTKFATTDHCGTIQILNGSIEPEYLLYAIAVRKLEESFDRSFRASLTNMKRFKIRIPVSDDGTFDVETQKSIAHFYTTTQRRKADIQELKEKLDDLLLHYLN